MQLPIIRHLTLLTNVITLAMLHRMFASRKSLFRVRWCKLQPLLVAITIFCASGYLALAQNTNKSSSTLKISLSATEQQPTVGQSFGVTADVENLSDQTIY